MVDLRETFVAEPRRRFVLEPADVDTDPAGTYEERAWEQSHPKGRATMQEDQLVLWNFAVGSAELKNEHTEALESFWTRHHRLVLDESLLQIVGHASATGTEALNRQLSEDRASVVAAFFLIRGVPLPSVKYSGAGEEQPRGTGASGEALAQDRRVEVTVVRRFRPAPAPEPPEEASVSVSWTIPVGPRSFTNRFGDWYIEGEIAVVSLETTPERRSQIQFEVSSKALEVNLEKNLSETISVTGGTDGIALGVKVFKNLTLDVKFKPDPEFPQFPVTGGISAEALDEPLDLLGYKLKIVRAEIRFGLLPKGEILRQALKRALRFLRWLASWSVRLAASGEAAAAGAGALYLAFVFWGIANLIEDSARGERLGVLAIIRKSYATSIAHAAKNISATESDIEGQGFEYVRAARRIGWELGEEAWSLETTDREAIRRELGKLSAAKETKAASDAIVRAIGGLYTEAPIPNPSELGTALALQVPQAP
jgi:outer membrane protein OmpA-like peptidoglycan-associated protein